MSRKIHSRGPEHVGSSQATEVVSTRADILTGGSAKVDAGTALPRLVLQSGKPFASRVTDLPRPGGVKKADGVTVRTPYRVTVPTHLSM